MMKMDELLVASRQRHEHVTETAMKIINNLIKINFSLGLSRSILVVLTKRLLINWKSFKQPRKIF